jgi:hypothetical protein
MGKRQRECRDPLRLSLANSRERRKGSRQSRHWRRAERRAERPVLDKRRGDSDWGNAKRTTGERQDQHRRRPRAQGNAKPTREMRSRLGNGNKASTREGRGLGGKFRVTLTPNPKPQRCVPAITVREKYHRLLYGKHEVS